MIMDFYWTTAPHLQHYACFKCRKAFKRPFVHNIRAGTYENYAALCPQCRAPMHALGLNFKAPAQSNVMQWRKVERLFQLGITFHSWGWTRPGQRPQSLRDIDASLAESAQAKSISDWKNKVAKLLSLPLPGSNRAKKLERKLLNERKWRKAKKDLAAKRMRKLIAAQGQEL